MGKNSTDSHVSAANEAVKLAAAEQAVADAKAKEEADAKAFEAALLVSAQEEALKETAKLEAAKKAEADAKAAEKAKTKADEEKAKADSDAKALAELEAALSQPGKKLYRPTKGFVYVDTEQNVRFEPGEKTSAVMTSWLHAQIKAGYIEEVVAE